MLRPAAEQRGKTLSDFLWRCGEKRTGILLKLVDLRAHQTRTDDLVLSAGNANLSPPKSRHSSVEPPPAIGQGSYRFTASRQVSSQRDPGHSVGVGGGWVFVGVTGPNTPPPRYHLIKVPYNCHCCRVSRVICGHGGPRCRKK